MPSANPDEIAARRMIGDDKVIATKLAEMQGVPFGKTVATPQEEDDLYWLEDPTVDEHALRGQINPQTGKPFTEVQIGYAKFPKKRKLIYTGTRALDLKERIAYVKKMNQRHEDKQAQQDEGED